MIRFEIDADGKFLNRDIHKWSKFCRYQPIAIAIFRPLPLSRAPCLEMGSRILLLQGLKRSPLFRFFHSLSPIPTPPPIPLRYQTLTLPHHFSFSPSIIFSISLHLSLLQVWPSSTHF